MPIKFRCPHCRQFLGISRNKAGEVTDCPTCGMSIRVPGLDGKVEPIPAPALNLADSGLAQALDELAQIGGNGGGEETLDQPAQQMPRSIEMGPAPPTPAPIHVDPVVVSVMPTPRAKPSQADETDLQTKSSALESVATKVEHDAALAELAEQFPTQHPSTSSRRRSAGKSLGLWGALAGGIALLALGYLLGRAGRPVEKNDQLVASPPESVVPAAALAEPVAAPSPSLQGRLTYVTAGGETRPDAGAHVIVLPTQRQGTVMLPEGGFLVGSSDVDAAVASASLRTLGGDLATANADGLYEVRLPQAGEYTVVLLSRHQARDAASRVDEAVARTLGLYFTQPAALLGKLSYDAQPFAFRGEGTAVRDHQFPRP